LVTKGRSNYRYRVCDVFLLMCQDRGLRELERETADPSTALRSGRDDKGEGGASIRGWLVDDWTADPSASLGMRKGRVVLPRKVG
jgi:hypothetical protein